MSPSAEKAIKPFAAGPYGGAGSIVRIWLPTTMAAATLASVTRMTMRIGRSGVTAPLGTVRSIGSHLSGNVQAGRWRRPAVRPTMSSR
jgi:hypothetical protein